MKYYIEKSINFFGDKISTKVSSPANKCLHNIEESSTLLENKDADILHSIVAKLLLVEKIVRPHINPAISFLCTRFT